MKNEENTKVNKLICFSHLVNTTLAKLHPLSRWMSSIKLQKLLILLTVEQVSITILINAEAVFKTSLHNPKYTWNHFNESLSLCSFIHHNGVPVFHLSIVLTEIDLCTFSIELNRCMHHCFEYHTKYSTFKSKVALQSLMGKMLMAAKTKSNITI